MYIRTYPQFLIDATPGAPEAQAALQAETEALLAIQAKRREASAALVSKAHRANGTFVKNDDVTTAEFDRLTAENAALDREATTQERRRDRAAKHLEDVLCSPTPEVAAHRKNVAANRALELHARAVELWDELQQILTERDTAYSICGSPGRAWTTQRGARQDRLDGGITDAKTIMDARIGGFDVQAVDTVANGGKVLTEAERAQAARAAAEDAHQSSAKAVRARSRREGY